MYDRNWTWVCSVLRVFKRAGSLLLLGNPKSTRLKLFKNGNNQVLKTRQSNMCSLGGLEYIYISGIRSAGVGIRNASGA